MTHSRPAEHESGGVVSAQNVRDQQDHSPTGEHGNGGAVNTLHARYRQGPLTSCRAWEQRSHQCTTSQLSAGSTHVLQSTEV